MRLIDADALVKHCNGNPFITDSVKSYVQISVATMQTIEERKTGKWINAYPDIEPNPMLMYGICSVCGFEQSISDKLKYCPNCGARMVQEGEEP